MTTIPTERSHLLLHARVEAAAGLWLVVLPLLRPLVWSGQPTDVANLFYLVLLAAAIATGLLLRGLESPSSATTSDGAWWSRPLCWGGVFLGFALLGCLNSPSPASAWALTVGWALHLAAPLALWPAIRRRPHLVFAGLLAGLAGELLLLVGQVCWERPRLAAQIAGDPAWTVERRVAEQYQARIGSWRLEGTFLLANTLASWLLLVVPLLVACAWREYRERGASRWWVVVSALAALGALALTGSKAGILALLVAGLACAVVCLRSWRWRAGAVGLVAIVLTVSWCVPSVRQAAEGSAGVRLDYWRAGIALVQERPLAGHGLEGFATHYPRVKPPSGEETILAHQETLQAAVDLGIPAMLVLLGWWATILWTVRPRQTPVPLAEVPSPPPGRTVLIGVPVLLTFAFVVAGVLQGNFAAYPGAMPLVWATGFIIALVMVVQFAARLRPPPLWACWCAVLAVLLHVQADFSLHSMQVVGTLAWVGMLGQALALPRPTAEPTLAGTRRQALFAAAGLVILAVVTAGIMATSTRGEVLERARTTEAVLARLRLAEAGRLDDDQRGQVLDAFEHAYARVVVEDRGAALTSDPREALALATIRRALDASRRFPRDHDLVFVAVAIGEHLQALLPARAEVLTPTLEALVAEWPGDLLVIKALSENQLRLARRATGERRHVLARQAQAMAQRAVELYPTHLPLRRSVILAAEMTGDQETITAQRAEIARLAPLVHRDNRLPD